MKTFRNSIFLITLKISALFLTSGLGSEDPLTEKLKTSLPSSAFYVFGSPDIDTKSRIGTDSHAAAKAMMQSNAWLERVLSNEIRYSKHSLEAFDNPSPTGDIVEATYLLADLKVRVAQSSRVMAITVTVNDGVPNLSQGKAAQLASRIFAEKIIAYDSQGNSKTLPFFNVYMQLLVKDAGVIEEDRGRKIPQFGVPAVSFSAFLRSGDVVNAKDSIKAIDEIKIADDSYAWYRNLRFWIEKGTVGFYFPKSDSGSSWVPSFVGEPSTDWITDR